jgi:glycosyltransferase involved in cell wall biosynthesis
MPLPDNDWTRGKCAFKAIQYMAVGIPTIVSPVGTNREVVKPNMGFFAISNQEWYENLCGLIDNPELRNKFNKEARQEVIENYSVKNNINKLCFVIDRCVR